MRVRRTCPDCGYTGAYATAPLADAHHPRHSCAKHRRALEQTRRHAERIQARVTRECTHPQARHQHGTRAAYVKDRCRCPDCTAANTAASRTATRERIYGRWHPYVDAGPVREHIAALRDAGIGVERIAQLAGLSTSHIRQLAQPGRGDFPATQRVRPSTAARVLSVGIDNVSRAARSRVDAIGTHRRLQALIAIGWTAEVLAEQLGRRPNSLLRSMTGLSVTVRTANDVANLYERLWNATPPQATRVERAAADAARAHAAAQGWLPPLTWDDIDADPTPPAPLGKGSRLNDVDEIAVERALAGDHISYDHLTSQEQQEVVRRLSARGASIRDIATQLGTTKRTISRRRASLGAASRQSRPHNNLAEADCSMSKVINYGQSGRSVTFRFRSPR